MPQIITLLLIVIMINVIAATHQKRGIPVADPVLTKHEQNCNLRAKNKTGWHLINKVNVTWV
jgi:hypothetical protein